MHLSPKVREWWHQSIMQQRWSEPFLLAAWLASGYLVARSYQQLIGVHGLSSYALAERDDEKTSVFYDHLFQGVSLPQPLTVLDIGCGMGDLIPYLQQRNMPISGYLGLDLVKPFVRASQQRYGGAPYHFRHQNFINPAFQPRQQYTLVVNLGCMVSRVVAYETYLAYCCRKMLRSATHGVVFNVITDVQSSSTNYTQSKRIGQVTSVAKMDLLSILDQSVAGTNWRYTLHDVQIYADATDTFVYLYAPHNEHTSSG